MATKKPSPPPVGSRWAEPYMAPRAKYPMAYIIDDRPVSYRGMVAAHTSKRHTTKDQFGWPVYHPKGEHVLLRIDDLGTRLLPDDEAALRWWKENRP